MSIDWQIVKTILWSYFKAYSPIRTSRFMAYVTGKKPSRANLIAQLIIFANIMLATVYGSSSVGRIVASSHNPTTYLSGLLNLAFLLIFVFGLLTFGPAMATSSPLTVGDTETQMMSPVNEETLLVGKVLTFLTVSNPYSIPAFLGVFIGVALSGLVSPLVILIGPILYHLVVLSASWISTFSNFYLLKHSSQRVLKIFWGTIIAVILVAFLAIVLTVGFDTRSILRLFSYTPEKWWLLILPSTYAAQALIYSSVDVQLPSLIINITVLSGIFLVSWLAALRSVKGILFKTISENQIRIAETRRTFGYAALKQVSLPRAFESPSGRLLPEGASVAIFLERRSFFRGPQFVARLFLPVFLLVIFLPVLARIPLALGSSVMLLLLMELAGFEAVLLGMSSATSLSQEGKNIWVVLSSPVRLEEYLIGKCYLNLLVNSVIQFVMVFVTAVFVKLPLVEAILLSSASVFWVASITGVGQWIGAKYATFESFEMNIASQSVQMGGGLPAVAGILYFLLSSLISEVSLLLPVLVMLSLRNTVIALLVGLLYSIIINLVLFNFFIKRAGKTLAKREYLVTA